MTTIQVRERHEWDVLRHTCRVCGVAQVTAARRPEILRRCRPGARAKMKAVASMFKSVPRSAVAQLPVPSEAEIRDAMERGQKARARAAQALGPGMAGRHGVFYR